MGPNIKKDTETGIYYFDRFGNMELLYREQGISSMYPIPLTPRPSPPILPTTNDKTLDSEGEFILADFVQMDAERMAARSDGRLDAGELITAFYGNFQFWVTLIGLSIQLFLVSRIYRTIGVRGALVINPVIVAFGYALLALSPMLVGFVPVFTIVKLVKITENSVDYSLMNTTRQALFLPVDRDSKYEGKTAIDTFFWRFGDLIQAGVVFAGLHWLNWSTSQFAILNFL